MHLRSGRRYCNEPHLLSALPQELFNLVLSFVSGQRLLALRLVDKPTHVLAQDAFEKRFVHTRRLRLIPHSIQNLGRIPQSLQAKVKILELEPGNFEFLGFLEDPDLGPYFAARLSVRKDILNFGGKAYWQDYPEEVTRAALTATLRHVSHVQMIDLNPKLSSSRVQLILRKDLLSDRLPAQRAAQRVLARNDDLNSSVHRISGFYRCMRDAGLTCQVFVARGISPIALKPSQSNIGVIGLRQRGAMRACLLETTSINLSLCWNSWDPYASDDDRSYERPKVVAEFVNAASNLQETHIQVVCSERVPWQRTEGPGIYRLAVTTEAKYTDSLTLELNSFLTRLRPSAAMRRLDLSIEGIHVNMAGLCSYVTRCTSLTTFHVSDTIFEAENFDQIFSTIASIALIEDLSLNRLRILHGKAHMELRIMRTLANSGTTVPIQESGEIHLKGTSRIVASMREHGDLFGWKLVS